MHRRHLLALLPLALTGRPAHAHLAPGSRGPHGGQVQGLGPYHGEMLARDGELVLFLFDHHNQPVDARQASGSATLLPEGRRQAAVLPLAARPDGSALVAQGEFAASPGLRVLVQLIPGPGLARSQARFAPPPVLPLSPAGGAGSAAAIR